VIMLFGLTWLMGLTAPIFHIFHMGISWRDIILIGGGLFLIAKGTHEIHTEVEARDGEATASSTTSQAFTWVMCSWLRSTLCSRSNSIITAIGMASDLEVMIAAVVIAIDREYVAAGPVGNFIAEHPTTKMLALAFLLADRGGAGCRPDSNSTSPRGYIYFAMVFAGAVETFNVLATRKPREAVHHQAVINTTPGRACPPDQSS